MAKVLVLYYRCYGHVEQMAERRRRGRARGGRRGRPSSGCPNWCPRRSPSSPTTSSTSRRRSPTVDELADYDAIIFGTPTRFGNMAAQMRNFLDQTGGLWMQGKLVGKVGCVFTSTATQHGGQEIDDPQLPSRRCCIRAWSSSACPTPSQGQMGVDEIKGGSPYGATTIAGGDGSRQPSQTSSMAPASRAATSPGSRRNWPAKADKKKARITPSLERKKAIGG